MVMHVYGYVTVLSRKWPCKPYVNKSCQRASSSIVEIVAWSVLVVLGNRGLCKCTPRSSPAATNLSAHEIHADESDDVDDGGDDK